jgi:hypothetical protein
MKTRTLLTISILVLAVLIILGSYAATKRAISDEILPMSDEDFFDVFCVTWINTDYGGGNTGQKIIIRPDGTREIFSIVTSTIIGRKEKFTLLDKWSDAKGTIWYRGHWECLTPNRSKGYEMGKLSDSGNTWEVLFASEDFPIEEWEPERFEYNYRVYYRQ